MSATKNKRAVILGIFILLGTALLVAIILVLGGQKKSFSKTITLKAVFEDVSGLQQGNNIWLSGVKVGTVKNISFNPDTKVTVSMDVLASMRPYIHKDAKAKIGSESLIGNKIVVLTGGSVELPVVESGDVLGIQGSVSTDEMMATFQQSNQNLLGITNDLKSISDRIKKGQGSVGKLLQDETLANTLQRSMNAFNQAADNAVRLTNNISAFTARLQSKGTLANDLVSDTIIFQRLRNSVSQLQQIMQTGQTAVNNLKEASSGLNSSGSPVGVLLNDPKAAADLQATLNHLNGGSQKLEEDLEALQHNFLLRGFFRKKEKARADSIKKAMKQ